MTTTTATTLPGYDYHTTQFSAQIECLSPEILVYMLDCGADTSYSFMWRATTAFLLCSKQLRHVVATWRLTVHTLDFLPAWNQNFNGMNDKSMQHVHLIKTMIATFPNVATVLLHKACPMTDRVFSLVMLPNPGLKKLDLGYFRHKLGDDTMEALSTRFPNLTYLRICAHVVDDVHVATLAAKKWNLDALLLSKSSEVTDRGLRFICKAYPLLRMIELQESKVTDEGIHLMTAHCKQLRYIDLSSSVLIGSSGIKCIASKYPTLRFINISGCRKIKDGGVAELAQCVHLEACLLGKCVQTKDADIIALSNGCPHLRVLDLSHCHRVTDVAINTLASKCHALANVGMSHCHRLTDASVLSLMTRCTKLKHLAVDGCHTLTGEVYTAATKRAIKLKNA